MWDYLVVSGDAELIKRDQLTEIHAAAAELPINSTKKGRRFRSRGDGDITDVHYVHLNVGLKFLGGLDWELVSVAEHLNGRFKLFFKRPLQTDT